MPVPMSNADEVMDPNELAFQTASVDITGTSWLESSILVEKVKALKEICLGNCRLLYGSERFKFYDIVICEDEDTKEFGAILTCNQNNHTKLLRTETSDSPVKAVRILVDRLQKDTAKLFLKYTVGSQLEGQQGSTDKDTGIYALWDSVLDKRICGHDDDTAGLVRSWSDAPGGARRPPPRGPRYDVADGPSKRRKKNDGSGQPVRGLEHFFAKQAAKAAPKDAPTSITTGGTGVEPDAEGLTDEQLARKLQEQWDKEDRERELGAQPVSSNELYEEPRNSAPTEATKDLPVHAKEPRSPEHETVEQKTKVVNKPQKNTLSLQSTASEEDVITANIPFDQSPLEFDPTEYIPDLQKHWVTDGGHATYALLTRCFILVNSTTSRIKIVDTLVNLLRTIIESDPGSLLPAVWLATNAISPPYIDLELGLGGSAISKALKKVCGLDNASLKALSSKHGDAGDVAFEAKKKQSFTLRKPKPLTIKSVFDSLVKIANSKGNGSVENKQRIVERLVQDARGAEESRYIVRTLVQHLRIGAVKTTMLIALSRAFMLSKPPGADFDIRDRKDMAKLKKEELAEIYSRNEETVKACFARRPNYNDLIPVLLEIGVCDELLVRCGLALHIPLRPMLGSITRDMGEMLTKLQGRDFACEYKYDGQRAQVHCDDKGKVTIFSRHLEVMTDKYPDLVALVPKIRGEGVSSFILEGEVVAVDRESGDLKTFQTLANRARKDVVIGAVTIDVCLFSFDLMYLNGEELLNRPFRERRSLLKSLFVEIPHHFTWVKSLDATSADVEAVQSFFQSALEIKCEGIMVKILDNLPNPDLFADGNDETGLEKTPSLPPTPKKKKPTKSKAKAKPTDAEKDEPQAKPPGRRKALLSTYEPDKRLDSWLKVKKDYSTTSETLDLIPIAAFHGSGRKAAWWSPILLAIRNAETGQLEAVTKCMSGFTDAFYKANRAKYNPDDEDCTAVLDAKPHYVEYNGGAGTPAVWFEPQEVWEVAFADLTLSPTYTAAIGLVSEERGLSTRFPRFLRVREDKGIEEATEAAELAALYRKQEAKAPLKKDEGIKDEEDENEG
ncbi:dna ligase 1 [Stemphylium lycopersici]|uniref:DNA ligase n=1 Tax=Stemphylium lycopersici TaxID=183478 RepID=A0A364N6D9_STELY|nr:dna ligase 1 [Stemphylium lycopersici]RAR12797.1 ATP-dependent DNA ligase [Stemphylium lycopersici]